MHDRVSADNASAEEPRVSIVDDGALKSRLHDLWPLCREKRATSQLSRPDTMDDVPLCARTAVRWEPSNFLEDFTCRDRCRRCGPPSRQFARYTTETRNQLCVIMITRNAHVIIFNSALTHKRAKFYYNYKWRIPTLVH